MSDNTNCGYSCDASNQSSAEGPLVTTQRLAPVVLGSIAKPYGSFGGEVTARADHGSLGVASVAGLVGSSVNTDAVRAASAALFDDVLTASSSLVTLGSAGFVRYVFDLDGSLTTPAAPVAFHDGFALIQLDYQHADGPIYQDA